MEGTDAWISSSRSQGKTPGDREVPERGLPRSVSATVGTGPGTPVRGYSRRRTAAMPRARLVGALLLLALALAAIFAPWSQAIRLGGPIGAGQPFISVEAGQLAAGGEPWTPVGFNDYRMTEREDGYLCDAGGGGLDDAELGERLDRVRAGGGNVVRTWFFQSYWDPDGDGSGDWAAFDRVLDAAAERGIRVIPVLTNHWGACEGEAPEKDYDFYAGGYREPHGGAALSYLDYAAEVADHYADSPAVAYWQLVNEPEAPSSEGCVEAAASAALAGFAEDASAAIRAADDHHLISLGTIGSGQCGTASGGYQLAQEAVDVCELHVYEATTAAIPEAMARIGACEAAGKPTVAGEIGIAADVDELGRRTGVVDETTLDARARLLDDRLAQMLAGGLDGFLVWQLVAETPDPGEADPYGVGPCDPVLAVTRGFGADAGADRDGCADGAAPS